MKAYLTLQHGHRTMGTLYLDLFDRDVPKTVANFVSVLQERRAGKGYKGCSFHRIIKGFMAQGGDFTAGDGTGGSCSNDASIDGSTFDDENFVHKHNRAGALSMANSGPNTNASQFFITFKSTPHLDGKRVVFGQVDLLQSANVLEKLENVRCAPGNNVPLQFVTIVECGVVEEENERAAPLSRSTMTDTSATGSVDQDEIDIESDADETANEQGHDELEQVPTTKAEAIKLRLRKLKQKMNQARQLNKQAVKEEGERITDVDKERRRQTALSKKSKEVAWEAANAKAVRTAAQTGVDAKALTEQAADSVRAARAKADKDKLNRYQINDYHNPEGQHRNYQKNLKSLPTTTHPTEDLTTADGSTAGVYNPLDQFGDTRDPEQHRQGAHRVAAELHRRIEKSNQRDRKRKLKASSGETSGINQRNQRFNEKINRTYDKQTAEIRQNLERGTAL